MAERKSNDGMKHLSGGDDVLGGMSTGARVGADAPAEDAVELWARRTGRALALIATVGLIGWCVYQATGAP